MCRNIRPLFNFDPPDTEEEGAYTSDEGVGLNLDDLSVFERGAGVLLYARKVSQVPSEYAKWVFSGRRHAPAPSNPVPGDECGPHDTLVFG